jgi:hypothetical protein
LAEITSERDGLVAFSEVRLEASLPKVLYGTNAGVELEDDGEIAAALAEVQGTVQRETSLAVDVAGWSVRRVDVTADMRLEDEALVRVALLRLGTVPLRGRYPVRGEHLSVSWKRKKGSFTRKAYSKYQESGEEAARGVLRLEVGVLGQAAAKLALRQDRRVEVRGRDLTGATGAALREKVGGAMSKLVGPYVKEVVDVDIWTAFRQFRRSKRSDAAMRMLAYAKFAQMFGGVEGLSALVTRQTVWKLKKEFEEAGVDPMEVDFTQGGAAEALREMGRSSRDEWERRLAGVAADVEEEHSMEGLEE